jgi:hypothetical protein
MKIILIAISVFVCGCSPIVFNVNLPGSVVKLGYIQESNIIYKNSSFAGAMPEKYSEIGDAAHTINSAPIIQSFGWPIPGKDNGESGTTIPEWKPLN